jgi:hypothetical protein
VPVHPAHPDPEELAAWQAGDLPGPGSAHIEAHVAGCADCARVLASVQRGRAALAELVEVDPPAGLHERLITAVERETAVPAPAGGNATHGRRSTAAAQTDGGQERRSAAAAGGDGLGESAPTAEPIRLDRRRRGRRSHVGRRRIAVLSAAAAVVLLVVGLVPLLRHGGGQTMATQRAERGAATASGDAGGATATGNWPLFSAPNGYSGTALRSALASDPDTRSAYRRAASGASDAQAAPRLGPSAPVAPHANSNGGSSGGTKGSSGTARSTAAPQALTGVQQDACVTSARNQAGDQGLRPAFFVSTVYRGQPATVLVTVRSGAPDHADLWTFPLDGCSAPPLAHDRVIVSPP